jgi:WD40-like Beta Propeller Repeat
MTIIRRALVPALVVAVALAAALAASAGPHLSPWTTAQKIDEIAGNDLELNTPLVDGCPIESPDGLSLYLASNRPGSIESAPGVRSLDIWVAHRETRDAPFGAPVNLGPAVNSTADDFCPTPVRGHGLFFVSRRTIVAVTCGMGDIYFTRFNPANGWNPPEHLGCAPEGPNSSLDEQGPSYVKAGGQKLLYFSSSSAGVAGDIYVSARGTDGTFGPASPVGVLNSASNDIQPNVRKDGREVVFSSNRPDSLGQDIWVSVREHADDPWPAPTRLGSEINTAAAETRPSFSGDAQRLYFGRAPGPEGMNDIYLATRQKLKGPDR